jgi:hypothetical protein
MSGSLKKRDPKEKTGRQYDWQAGLTSCYRGLHHGGIGAISDQAP